MSARVIALRGRYVSEAKPSEVPSLETVLHTLGYHVACIMTDRPVRKDEPYASRCRFGLGLGGYAEGCPFVRVNVTIAPSGIDDDPWGVWAQVSFDDKPWEAFTSSALTGPIPGLCHGNRCGGREAYTRLCAPVVAWVAAYWAAKEGTKTAAAQ
jgi:hypothetical protein